MHRSRTPKAGGLSLNFIKSGIRRWAIVIFFSCKLAFCGKPCRWEESKEKQLLSVLCYSIVFSFSFFLYQRVQTNLTTFVFNPEIRFGVFSYLPGSSDLWPHVPYRTTGGCRQILWRTTMSDWCLWRRSLFNSSPSQPWWVVLLLLHCAPTHLSLCPLPTLVKIHRFVWHHQPCVLCQTGSLT